MFVICLPRLLKRHQTVLSLEPCTLWLFQVVIQPRSQGLSAVRPWPFFKGRKKRNPGNEVGCYHLGKYIFNLDLPQVDFWLIHQLFISLTQSERVTNLKRRESLERSSKRSIAIGLERLFKIITLGSCFLSWSVSIAYWGQKGT